MKAQPASQGCRGALPHMPGHSQLVTGVTASHLDNVVGGGRVEARGNFVRKEHLQVGRIGWQAGQFGSLDSQCRDGWQAV